VRFSTLHQLIRTRCIEQIKKKKKKQPMMEVTFEHATTYTVRVTAAEGVATVTQIFFHKIKMQFQEDNL
jgi:hypothetical protein